jgi:hypothetical protein
MERQHLAGIERRSANNSSLIYLELDLNTVTPRCDVCQQDAGVTSLVQTKNVQRFNNQFTVFDINRKTRTRFPSVGNR